MRQVNVGDPAAGQAVAAASSSRTRSRAARDAAPLTFDVWTATSSHGVRRCGAA